MMMDFFVSHMHLKMLLAKCIFCIIIIIMNPPTVKKYKSYTSPKSSPKSKRKGPRKSSNSSRRTAAAQKIQRMFRTKRSEERPPTTCPSVQQIIFSMKDLNDLRLSQARRATGHRGSSRAQYHLGATGSW